MADPIFSISGFPVNSKDWSQSNFRTHTSVVDGKTFSLDNLYELNSLLEGKHVTARVALLVKHLYKCCPEGQQGSSFTIKCTDTQAGSKPSLFSFISSLSGSDGKGVSTEVKVDRQKLDAAVEELMQKASSWHSMWHVLSSIKNFLLGRGASSTFRQLTSPNDQGKHIFSKKILEDFASKLTSTQNKIESQKDPEYRKIKPLVDAISASLPKLEAGSSESEVSQIISTINKALEKIPEDVIGFTREGYGIHSSWMTQVKENILNLGYGSNAYRVLRNYSMPQIEHYLLPELKKSVEKQDGGDSGAVFTLLKTLSLLIKDVDNMKKLTPEQKDNYSKNLTLLLFKQMKKLSSAEPFTDRVKPYLSCFHRYTKDQVEKRLIPALKGFEEENRPQNLTVADLQKTIECLCGKPSLGADEESIDPFHQVISFLLQDCGEKLPKALKPYQDALSEASWHKEAFMDILDKASLKDMRETLGLVLTKIPTPGLVIDKTPEMPQNSMVIKNIIAEIEKKLEEKWKSVSSQELNAEFDHIQAFMKDYRDSAIRDKNTFTGILRSLAILGRVLPQNNNLNDENKQSKR